MRALLSLPYLLCGLCVSFVPPLVSEAQQAFPSISAKSALETLSSRFGQEQSGWIAEMQGTDGQPQPAHWELLVYSARSPGNLHRYLVSSDLVRDGGPESGRYPSSEPNGFFRIEDVGVDSVAAFTIAEAEARKAKVGFDSCDYFLTVREFSRETVWRLELVDAARRLVGKIYLSGANGEVLRTVWLVQDAISGFSRIIDSAAPGSDMTNQTFRSPPIMVPGETGQEESATGIARVPSPYTPVNPGGFSPANPSMTPNVESGPAVPPRTGSIFKEFSPRGGGGSVSNMTPLPGTSATSPVPPSVPGDPSMDNIPDPEPIPIPSPEPAMEAQPGPTSPPINVPSGGGASERIPPPPVPGI